ncbi:MAG TPA: ABC transporter permease [Thermoanaerobaculia bacterium]|nr:ABC transporter permease [Thermoanaerobaculia bacterium]
MSASEADAPGVPVYDTARRGFLFVEEAKALWQYRHLVGELVARDLKIRYKRSVLGVAWSMLSPLLSMVALTIAFSALLRQQIANYPAYFLAGSVFWTFFAQATSHAASLTADASEIARRVYVPRSVFVAAAVGGALVNLLYTLVPLFLIIAATGHPIHATWFFLPVSILAGVLFTSGVGLVIFTMASRFVDVKETYLVVLSTWFFLTPIVYTPAILAPKYRLVVRLNPMTYLVEMFRAPIYDGWLPGPNTLAFSLLAGVLSLVFGWLFYAWKIEDYGTHH